MPGRRTTPKRLDYARLHERVASLHESVRTREALAIHRKVLRDDNPHALSLFGRVAASYHAFPIAIRLLERAIECGAADANDFNELGLACLGAGRLEAALGWFEEAAGRDPSDYRAPVNAALVLQEEGELDAALERLEGVAASHPEEPAVALRLAELQLRRAAPREALALLGGLRDRKLHPTWPLALEAVAHAELGDATGLAALMRYDEFVQAIEAEAPDGFADVASFNARLCNHVSRHRTMLADPDGLSTRNGRHSIGNLLRDRTPVLQSLESAILRAVDRYVRALPAPDGHPFLERPEAFRLETWAVVLGRQGYHEAHVHRGGWVSGVYYVRVGDVVSDDAPGCEGWLELGQGPASLYACGSTPATQRIRPRDGIFVLFPSYCWHRTLPFSANGERVAIAFDVIPRSA